MDSQTNATDPTGRRSPARRFGPGLVITASFVGPGTVTTATVTGAGYGYALLWTILFSVLATIVLQEMSARLGLVSRQSLGAAMRGAFTHPVPRVAVILLVITAIGVGGAAYAGGDTTGTALGLTALTGLPQPVVVVVVGAIVLGLLSTGRYKYVERLLTALVGVMSVVFLLAAVLAGPDLGELVTGIFVPSIPDGALLTTIALIGTTVVPYNMFLHASIVQEKWPNGDAASLREARQDTTISISVGGLITLAIAITAAATMFTRGIEAESASALATQLEPLLGPAAQPVFGLGLFSAGLTSAVAGPLGAAYAITSVLGWSTDLSDPRFKAIWAVIVVIGVGTALADADPVSIILLAQAANGILLPIIALFLLIVMNQRRLLGDRRNRVFGNVLGGFVLLVVTVLGAYQLIDVLGLLPS